MIRTHIPVEGVAAGGPLADVGLPMCLEDVAMQMGMVADDNADMALCHIEADRLLLIAIRMLIGDKDASGEVVAEITNNFHRIKKIYE